MLLGVNFMKTRYVNQCSCCGKSFMRLELSQRVPEHLEDVFVELLGNDVDDLFLSKQFYLSLEDGFIVGFYYEFQSKDEERSAEDLAWSVRAISNYLYDSYVTDQRKLTNEEFAY